MIRVKRKFGMNNMCWEEIKSITDLEQALRLSIEKPVIIFKHSRLCSLSSMVLSALEGSWNDAEMAEAVPHFLDLIAYRGVSNEIAHRLKIAHQSPQLLIIKDGVCVYSASHFDIKYAEILAVISPNLRGPLS